MIRVTFEYTNLNNKTNHPHVIRIDEPAVGKHVVEVEIFQYLEQGKVQKVKPTRRRDLRVPVLEVRPEVLLLLVQVEHLVHVGLGNVVADHHKQEGRDYLVYKYLC